MSKKYRENFDSVFENKECTQSSNITEEIGDWIKISCIALNPDNIFVSVDGFLQCQKEKDIDYAEYEVKIEHGETYLRFLYDIEDKKWWVATDGNHPNKNPIFYSGLGMLDGRYKGIVFPKMTGGLKELNDLVPHNFAEKIGRLSDIDPNKKKSKKKLDQEAEARRKVGLKNMMEYDPKPLHIPEKEKSLFDRIISYVSNWYWRRN